MTIESWQLWALLSAVFAALTAIYAKIGVENIGSDLATFIASSPCCLPQASSRRRVRSRHELGFFSFSRASERELPGFATSAH